MRFTKKRKIVSVLFLFSILLSILILSACETGDGGAGEEVVPYVNVYVPYCDMIVTVQYDGTLGKLKDLSETLETAVETAGHTYNSSAFLGIYDTAVDGNIVYNTDGILHSDYQFTNGVTLYARYKSEEDVEVVRSKSLIFNKWERNSTNQKDVFTSLRVTEGEFVTRFTPQTFTPGGDFAGWEEASSGRLVTDRDGYLLDDYDIWESTETEFYPRVVPGQVNRCYLHLEGGIVTFEYSSNLNATDVLPKDERDGRGIIGWSTDPKAKYPEDVQSPTYLGSKKVFFYVKENAHYYPIYSDYKDVTKVYGDQVETERIYRYYPSGSVWQGELIWDMQEAEYINLPKTYYKNGSGNRYVVIAYRTESGNMVSTGSVPFDEAESKYYGTVELSVKTAILYLRDGENETEWRYSLANSVIELPKPEGDGKRQFVGWYLKADGSGGKIVGVRTDDKGVLYITCEGSDKEQSYNVANTYTFYAIYSEGGDGQ